MQIQNCIFYVKKIKKTYYYSITYLESALAKQWRICKHLNPSRA